MSLFVALVSAILLISAVLITLRARKRAPPRFLLPATPASVTLARRFPPDLLAAVLSYAALDDVGAAARACAALRAVVRAPEYDALLWERLCRARWRATLLDPLALYPAELAKLALWRARFAWAERDGRRTCATARDLHCVRAWYVHLRKFSNVGSRNYTIADHPYRADMTYVSPTFGGEAVPWVLRTDDPDAPPGVATIQVLHGGLPPMLVVRRADWGWDLQNPHLELQSIEHGAPPPAVAAASEGVRRPPATAVAR